MSETLTNIRQRVMDSTGSNIGMMIMFVFVLIVSVYVAFQLYNIVVKTDLQTKVLVKDVINVSSKTGMFQLNMNSEDETVALPILNNGNEYSFSYWFYIDDFKVTTNPKLIMCAGSSASLADSGMIMYVDPSYTKMHLLMKTNATETIVDSLVDIHNNVISEAAPEKCSFFRMEVPYIPVSRWINFTVVVDDNYIQLFMDGELRQVIDTTEQVTNCGSLNMDKFLGSYNFYSGKPTNGEKLDGFISKMKFFNYALTVDHAKMVYKTGPVHQSILSKLGLPLYGIRNPFYRVDEDVDDTEQNE